MYEGELKQSSYPNCIKYHELDVALGCNVKCIYCGLAANKTKVEKVCIDNLLTELPKEVKGIYLSPNTDAFSKIAAESTHKVLEYYLPKGVNFLIITKNIIPTKTIELLSKYPDQITIKISLARLNQCLIDYIEPGSASAIDRLKTMKALVVAGLKVQALLMPMYPSVDDGEKELRELVEKIRETGVKLVKSAYVIIRNGTKEKDIEMIKKMKNHPALEHSWELMSETLTPQIGSGQIYPFNKRIEYYTMLGQICRENGMFFSACTVLDPALKKVKSSDFLICNDLKFMPNLL